MSKYHPENNNAESINPMDNDNVNCQTENTSSANNDVIDMEKQDEKADKSSFFPKKDKKHRKVEEKVELLEEEKNILNDKYLRLYSEFDNYRKRTAKEKVDLTKTATESLMKDLLPILDDFDRALNNIPANDERTQELYNGVNLIYQKFINTLKKKGLKEIEIISGSDFDCNFQEAVASIPAPSEESKGKVIDVIEKGYILNDNIIRFSKVVVGL